MNFILDLPEHCLNDRILLNVFANVVRKPFENVHLDSKLKQLVDKLEGTRLSF